MSKFKIGDRVRRTAYKCTGTVVGFKNGEPIVEFDKSFLSYLQHSTYSVAGKYVKGLALRDSNWELLVKSPSDEIHITTKGNRVIAVQKQNGKVINRAEAVCAPSDTFDFNTGAQLAFDRLTKPEVPCEAPTEDKPEPKYKVGDKVKIRADLKAGETAEGLMVHNTMVAHAGTVATIACASRESYGDRYQLKEVGSFWDNECLEPYTEPTQEPIKLYCVKDYEPNERLAKGKIYEIDSSGYMHWNEGLSICTYKSADDFFKTHPQLKGVLVPLVSRPAKVGEYIVPVRGCATFYLKGDMCQVKTSAEDYCRLANDSIISHENYLVLDGYQPEPEYFSGKVVCVDVGNAAGMVVGKVYSVKDGVFYDGFGRKVPKFYTPFESLEDMNRKCGEHSGAKFIEFVEG